MKFFFRFSANVTSVILAGVALFSCNRDEVIESGARKPQIILDNEYGVYTVKPGGELTIAPEYKDLDGGDVVWTMDEEIVWRGEAWTSTWPVTGEYYATVTASNSAGSVSEDIRIDVVELTPPVISVNIPQGGLRVMKGRDLRLEPTVQHADMEDFSILWTVDGMEVGREMTYTFNRPEAGIYKVRIEASNIDGSTSKEFDIEVTDTEPYSVEFTALTSLADPSVRYTYPGRMVYLRPTVSGMEAPSFRWAVDGAVVEGCDGDVFRFTPDTPGSYAITVTVNGGEGMTAEASVTVVCVDGDERSRMRPISAASSADFDRIYEWIPAPGQFINDTGVLGGMTGGETSHEAACSWATARLRKGAFVSLGSFGGYITAGFDHSIPSSGTGYDIVIGGNAFLSGSGASNEPGIVWVMQDVNGNGLPDDEWYQLKGSEWGAEGSACDYRVTYYRPSGAGMDVDWTASDGTSGSVRYMPLVHTQDSYYPAWVEADAYTLTGTLVKARTYRDPVAGNWCNPPYQWGYADNVGDDSLSGESSADGTGQRTGFRISNAVYPDGTPVPLLYVDFVRVQTAVLFSAGALGEVSTEVSAFKDYSMTAQ